MAHWSTQGEKPKEAKPAPDRIVDIIRGLTPGTWLRFNHDYWHFTTRYAQVLTVAHTDTVFEFTYQYLDEGDVREYWDNDVHEIEAKDEDAYYAGIRIRVVEKKEMLDYLEEMRKRIEGGADVKPENT